MPCLFTARYVRIHLNYKFDDDRVLHQNTGSSTRTKKGGHVHTYPFVESDPFGPKRTHSSFVEIANGSKTSTHVST